MSNQSYLSAWCADLPENLLLERFGAFLGTVPFSSTQPGFTHVTIRAIDASESPIYEEDLRSAPFDAQGILQIVSQYLNADSSYEVRAHWDLSVFDTETSKWTTAPQPLEIACFGEAYDGEAWRTSGHFRVQFGFEHLFTGHAGLLGIRRAPALAESAEEARFLERMAWPENLERYQKETRGNIQHLFDWVARILKEAPVQRVELWSEGEENFEARLEEILAAH